jgi:hypothetical protein
MKCKTESNCIKIQNFILVPQCAQIVGVQEQVTAKFQIVDGGSHMPLESIAF